MVKTHHILLKIFDIFRNLGFRFRSKNIMVRKHLVSLIILDHLGNLGFNFIKTEPTRFKHILFYSKCLNM